MSKSIFDGIDRSTAPTLLPKPKFLEARQIKLIDDVIKSAAQMSEAVMFGIDRSALAHFDFAKLKLYAREQQRMTIEELESALVGFDTSWENWPDNGIPIIADKHLPSNTMVGLTGWLPKESIE